MLTCLAFSLLPIAIVNPNEITIDRYQLDNGVRIIVAHVPEAIRQSTFTFLPLHLGNDERDRAQWSHLLEHHLIRSTDPEGLHVDGIDINGETTHHAARLDTIALPEQWPAALQRHAQWLTARSFNAEAHERELRMIHSEEQSTAIGGWTHKWAIAAWNQIVRHGSKHARVHGDVADSQVAQAMQYARNHLPINDSVVIATVGPIELEAVKERIAEHFSEIARFDREPPARVRDDEAPKQLAATWDLPTRHAMLWWLLADREPATIAAALAVGDAVQMRLPQDPAVTPLVRAALVHATVPTPEGVYFIINASLPRDGDAMRAAEAIDQALMSLAPLPGPLFMARSIPARMLDPQTLLMQRPHAPAHMAFALESNWLLQGVHIEYAAGCSHEDLKAALTELTQEDTAAFIANLRDLPGGIVVLEPAIAEQLQR